MSRMVAPSRWKWAKGVLGGAAVVAAFSVSVGVLGDGPSAAHSGSTTTTVAPVPAGVHADVIHAQSELSKLDKTMAELKAQQKQAAADLATLEKDVKDGALDRTSDGKADEEVSAAIATLFAQHGAEFAADSAQAQAFHEQFLNALSAAAGAYAQPSDSPGQ